MGYNCVLEVLMDGDHAYGFKLTASPEFRSEGFCAGMFKALKRKMGYVLMEGDEVVFQYWDDQNNLFEHRAKVLPSDLAKLRDLFGDPEIMWRDELAKGAVPGICRIAVNRMKMA